MSLKEEKRIWKQEIIKDIETLQKKTGVQSEKLEKLKEEFLAETNGIALNNFKKKLYNEIYKENTPKITLDVSAVKVATDGCILGMINDNIENILEDTQIIKDTEEFCTKTGRQLKFYLVKRREKYVCYEELDRVDVTEIVQNYLKNNSFNTEYKEEERGEL